MSETEKLSVLLSCISVISYTEDDMKKAMTLNSPTSTRRN